VSHLARLRDRRRQGHYGLRDALQEDYSRRGASRRETGKAGLCLRDVLEDHAGGGDANDRNGENESNDGVFSEFSIGFPLYFDGHLPLPVGEGLSRRLGDGEEVLEQERR